MPEEGDHGPRILWHTFKWETWKSLVSRLLEVLGRHKGALAGYKGAKAAGVNLKSRPWDAHVTPAKIFGNSSLRIILWPRGACVKTFWKPFAS